MLFALNMRAGMQWKVSAQMHISETFQSKVFSATFLQDPGWVFFSQSGFHTAVVSGQSKRFPNS